MSIQMSLLDMLQTMPRSQLPELELRHEDPSFSLDVHLPDGYVWPEVDVSYGEVPTPVLLVKAPGAMGKSMAAQAIAATLGAPLVDLSKMNVGSNSLTGMLFKVLGPGDAAQLLLGLDQGNTALVLDGLDEAQLRSGQQHFWSFLEDVASLLSTSRAQRQVIILGRPDATLAAELAFKEIGVGYEVVELKPLPWLATRELIRNSLDRLRIDGQPYRVHRTFAEPFEELERLVFQDLAHALDPSVDLDSDFWPKVAYFLGYPPVVQALASRLATRNPQVEIQGFRQSQPSVHQSIERGRLLQQVVDTIMDRESGKVRELVGQELQLGADDPKRTLLYTREEQTLRIVAYVHKTPLDIQLPASLSQVDRARYEELVEAFIPDHPLIIDSRIANAVFADYIRAFVAVAETTALHGVSRSELVGAVAGAGPFFVHFVSGMATLLPEIGLPSVPDSVLDDLLKSYIAGSAGNSYFTLVHGTDELYTLMLGTLPIDRRETDQILERDLMAQVLSFAIPTASSIVELSSPIARGTIVTPRGGLILTAPQGDLELGPGLVTFTDTLEIKASAVVVTDSEQHGPVLLAAKEFSGNPSTRIVARPPQSLMVNWPACWHPWKPYQRDYSTNGVGTAKSSLILVGLRRILTSFKQSASAEPSQYYEMLDNIIVGRNQLYAGLLERLIELEIIERDGSLYRLRLGELAPYGVNYAALRGPNFANKLDALLQRVLESERLKDLLQAM